MIQKPNLLLDVDEVICFEGFLDAVNDFLGTTYQSTTLQITLSMK